MKATARYSARFLCKTAIMASLICVMTMLIQIPIPLGYAHAGDAFILLTVLFVGKRSGIWAGGIGSALADLLTGFTVWVLPTLFIKSLMALLVGSIAYRYDGSFRLFSIRTVLACVAGMAWMVCGYTLFGALLYGGLAAGLASTPGLAVEGVFNLAVFWVIGSLLKKANLPDRPEKGVQYD